MIGRGHHVKPYQSITTFPDANDHLDDDFSETTPILDSSKSHTDEGNAWKRGKIGGVVGPGVGVPVARMEELRWC